MSAVLYQLMPPLSPEEYQELTEDIRVNGIQVPVIVDEDGVAIDGHHRQRIAEQLGVRCPTVVKSGLTDAEKRTMALNLNLHRRHLTREQKRQIVEASLKADPQLSDREHARRTGVSDHTAAKVRADLEESAQIAHFSTRTDPRTGEATQPATKPRPVSPATPDFDVDEWRGDVLHHAEATGGIVPLTGPNSVADPGVPQSPKPRRTPLTDQFRNATTDLTRKTETIARLCDDDRFPRNAEEVATSIRSDLIRAIDALTDVVNLLDSTTKKEELS